MKVQVEDDMVPPELLLEAATAYSCLCCAGVIELWRGQDGYWNATLAHDQWCRAEGAGAGVDTWGTGLRRADLAMAIG